MITVEHSQHQVTPHWFQHLYTVRLFGIPLYRSFVKDAR